MSATEKSCLYQRRMNVYFTDAQQAGEQRIAYCSVSDVVYKYNTGCVCVRVGGGAREHSRIQTHARRARERNSHAAAQFCLKLDLRLQLIHNHYSNNFSPKRKQYARALIRRHNLWPLFIICILNMRAPTTITLLLTAASHMDEE